MSLELPPEDRPVAGGSRAWPRSALAGAVIATLMLSGPRPGAVGATPTPGTLRAQDFIDSIGVGVHLAYTDSGYAGVDEVIEALRYLGLKHLREDNLDPRNQGQEAFRQVAAAGFKFNLIASGGLDPDQSLDNLRPLEQAQPGAVASIEGPNEINNFHVHYHGLPNGQAAIALQAALYAAVKRDPLLKAVPVYNFTSWPDFAGAADFANFHSYPKAGSQPLDTLVHDRRSQAAVMPGKPMVLTEAGYYTLPGPHGWGGVDEPTQAKLLLNLIMDATRLGIRRTYIYQLLDAYADPKAEDQEKHFGLFGLQGRRKAAADAIHNLTQILADPAETAATFEPGRLDYRVSGLSHGGGSLVLQKASGAFALVVWDEPRIWDNAKHVPIVAPTRKAKVDLGRSFAEVMVYDPLVGTMPTGAYADVRIVEVGVSDHPVLIVPR